MTCKYIVVKFNFLLITTCFFLACEIGFAGLNCATKCFYPSFGRGCQSECKCDKTLCNHVYGCMNTEGILVERARTMNGKIGPVNLSESENG